LLAEQAQPMGRVGGDGENHEQPIRRVGELPHEQSRERSSVVAAPATPANRPMMTIEHPNSTVRRVTG
jgi:hypothetical protein